MKYTAVSRLRRQIREAYTNGDYDVAHALEKRLNEVERELKVFDRRPQIKGGKRRKEWIE